MDQFPDDVRVFIVSNIASVSELEALLLLRGAPDKAWTAADVARTLYTSVEMMDSQLNELASKGLLERGPAASATYRYAPPTAELNCLVGRIADLYKERRVAVISLIYAEPDVKARLFADAFRIRKGK